MSVEFTATVRARGFDVSFTVGDGETVAVLGPNGSGKSTLLNLLAGLLRPDSGRAELNGRVLFDVAAGGRGRVLPPHRRGVSMLAQDALLFPHLSALDNVAFGPRSTGLSRAESAVRAAAWLERVDATELSSRKPGRLSGGQAQRIAVARALATDPALLLLDEPMAALDVSVAPALRRMLREMLVGRAAVIVTHDVLDAFTLADRVVVLEAGRVVDVGPTRAVLERPTNPFAAGLTGLNLLTGTVADGTAGEGEGESTAVLWTDAGHRVAAQSRGPLAAGARAGVSVRPAVVRVAAAAPLPATGWNVLPATVGDLEPRGDVIRVRSTELAADLPPGGVADLDLAPGMPVWFSFAAADALVYPL